MWSTTQMGLFPSAGFGACTMSFSVSVLAHGLGLLVQSVKNIWPVPAKLVDSKTVCSIQSKGALGNPSALASLMLLYWRSKTLVSLNSTPLNKNTWFKARNYWAHNLIARSHWLWRLRTVCFGANCLWQKNDGGCDRVMSQLKITTKSGYD